MYALDYEFKKAGIEYRREKKYDVHYKDIVMQHCFYADFVVFNRIILEVKAVTCFTDEFTAQCINYLKVSNNMLALMVNFWELSLNTKRIVL